MISIFACEDMQTEATQLEAAVNALARHRNIEISLQIFSRGEQLLLNFARGEADVVLLDIVMEGGMSGIETARKIREIDKDIPLAFTTSSIDYAIESYDVQAVHYVVKPLTEQAIATILDRCENLLASSRKTIDLTVNRTLSRVLVQDIVYAEVFGNRSMVKVANHMITTYTPLSSLLEETGSSFLRCHRSFIISMNHVLRIEGKEFLMDSGDRIPIRTNGRSAVVSTYQDYLAKGLR